mgnify:CR=1 FL=1
MTDLWNRIQEQNFLLGSFLIAVSSLAILNLLNYPYIPVEGVFFTSFFLVLSFVGCAAVMYYEDAKLADFYGAVFSSFAVVALLSRVFVNTAGIATPRSTGALGSLRIEQMWIGGIHLHHYWLGLSMLIGGIYMSKRGFSELKKGIIYGAGFALVIDEIGIILAGHTYHSWVSYLGLSVSYIVILGAVLDYRSHVFIGKAEIDTLIAKIHPNR